MKRFFLTPFLFIAFFPSVDAQDIEDTVELPTIVIRGKIPEKLPYITSMTSPELLQFTATRDVGEFLRSIPNVSGIRKGGSCVDPVVRGYKYSQLNVILNNGIRIENGCPNRMDPVSSHIEAEDIQNIEVIKGPFALKYGPNFGGVINLEAKRPEPFGKFQVHGGGSYGYETNWNGHKSHLYLKGGGQKVYFLLTGGYRNYGNYTSGKAGGKDTTFQSAFIKYNYSAQLGFALNKNQRILLGYDDVRSRDVMYPALSMDEKSDHTGIFSTDYTAINLSSFVRGLEVKAYHSGVHHIMDNSRRPSSALMKMVADVNASDDGGRIEIDMSSGPHNLLAGLDFENIRKDGERTGTMEMMGTVSKRITSLWKKASITNTGIFAEYHTPVSSVEFMASLRLDLNQASSEDTLDITQNGITYFHNSSSHFINMSASAGVTKIFSDEFIVSLAAGRGTRSPNMLERFIKLLPVGYDNFDYLGNPDLKPEINNELDLTFRVMTGKSGEMYLNGFYSVVQHYITANRLPPAVIKPQTQGVLGVKQFENADYILSRGFEFGYTSAFRDKLGFDVSSALTYATIPSVTRYILTGNQITGETLIKNDALPEIPPWEATFSVYYKFLKNSLIPKIALRTVADQNHTSAAFYEFRTPGFSILNFTALWKANNKIHLLAGVNNIFNRAYYEHLNRKIIGTAGKLYEPGRVFFINLSVNL